PIAAQGPSRNNLNVVFDLSESWASSSSRESQPSIGSGDFQPDGLASRLSATVDYARSRRRTELASTLLTSFRYLPDLARVEPVTSGGAISWGFRSTKQSALQPAAGPAYAPGYLYDFFPTNLAPEAFEPTPADPDYRIHSVGSYSYATNAAFVIG